MNYQLLLGDCVQVMKTLPANSVHMVCTSPPYFGLRDYQTATWEGGDADCNHVGVIARTVSGGAGKQYSNAGSNRVFSGDCACGARRVDNQIGLEETPEAYVAKLVELFREVRRVLHPTGTVWLNLGDSYNGSGGAGGDYGVGGLKEGQPKYPGRNVNGLGPKQLLGMPWRVAFALQADGWILRSEIIWHKKSCMPESVQDRPTRAHEQVFLLAKSQTYFYDNIAVQEPATESSGWARQRTNGTNTWKYNDTDERIAATGQRIESSTLGTPGTRNKRSVWTLGPESYDGAHFATMPTKLAEICILAGSSAHGACAKCGAPWSRVVERGPGMPRDREVSEGLPATMNGHGSRQLSGDKHREWKAEHPDVDRGWQPTCQCFGHFELIEPEPEYDEDGDETVASQLRPPRRVFVANGDMPEPVPCTVLDPFSGAASTGIVALKHHRRYVGIELNEDYIRLSENRLGRVQPMLLDVTA